MPIIEVCDLQKQYPLPDDKSQKFFAVNGVSLSIKQGEVFGSSALTEPARLPRWK